MSRSVKSESQIQTRSRKLTEKGETYKMQRLKEKFNSARLTLSRQMNTARKCLEGGSVDKALLRQQRYWVNGEMAKLENVHEQLNPVLEGRDQKETSRKYKEIKEEYSQLLHEITVALKVEVKDARSKSSRSSLKSQRSNTSQLRAAAAAEAAALEAELKFVEEEAAKKAELQKLEALKKLEIAKARLEAINQVIDESESESDKGTVMRRFFASLPNKSESEEEEDIHEEANVHGHKLPLNPRAPTFVPRSQVIGEEESLCRSSTSVLEVEALANAIQDSLLLSRLPTPEPQTFKGDPLQYVCWKLSFHALIERKNLSNAEKMFFLQKYLAGTALKAVEGYFFNMSEDSYKGAWALLDERFGHPFKIQEAFREKLSNWSKISGSNAEGLREYADFLRACKDATTQIPGLSILDDCKENQRLASKLPDSCAVRWNRKVTDALSETRQYPTFEDFVCFVSKEAMIACNPITSIPVLKNFERDVKKDTKPKVRAKGTTLTTTVDSSVNPKAEERMNKVKYCRFCKQSTHFLANCHDFEQKPIVERVSFVKENKLCFGCLRSGHHSKDCQRRHTCNKCKGKHPTVLHEDRFKRKLELGSSGQLKDEAEDKLTESMKKHSTVSCKVDYETNSTAMIVPVWLSSTGHPEEVLTYAILDNQSDATFITQDLASRISATCIPVRLSIKTVTSPCPVSEPSHLIKDLSVRGMNLDKEIVLPKTYTRDLIPCEMSQIPTGEMAENWPHLKHLSTEIPELQSCEVGLLIGLNCPAAGLPRQIISGRDEEPYAVRTDLGWSIVNGSGSDIARICHRINIKELPEITPHDVLSVLQADFADSHGSDKVVSQEDIQFLEILKSGISSTSGGHLIMPLPFKSGPPLLPNNRVCAEVRLTHLKRKLKRDPLYYDRYKKFMEDIIEKGDVEEAHGPGEAGKAWYIPHHGVYHPKKPNKLRVVFDCSAKCQNESLNDHLLTGPDLLNSLTGILHRFRQHPVAIMGDIERMFHQFLVNEEHRDYLRFLWWESGDVDTNPKEFRMKVHLFGAASSPGCANFGLKHLAEQYEEEFPEAARFIKKNFYVDDGLQSCKDEEEAISLVRGAQKICKQGGLRLHKFVSNSQTVLNSIEESERADEMTDINLYQGKVPTVLGVHWCIETDSFTFRYKPKNQEPTRRGILSAVASIYDPLGFIAPVVLRGKIVLQEMCKAGVEWDDMLPEILLPLWESWKEDCLSLSQIKIKRCFQPKDHNVVRTELHHFSDASSLGYGQCTYLRQVGDQVCCSLVCAKSRVAPLKGTTIPRLELTAALVSSQVSCFLKEELEIQIDEEFFWTDSKVVLSYINNDQRRFHVFVANRVRKIRELSNPRQWFYVPSNENPADLASRGASVSDLTHSDWFEGPDFLYDKSWKAPEDGTWNLAQEDPEVRKATCFESISSQAASSILDRFDAFSSWPKAVGALARLQRAAQKKGSRSCASCEERLQAEVFLIKLTQQKAFGEELKALQKKDKVKSTSALSSLNPFLDEKGILRVGGRLKNAKVSDHVKHPAILPKDSHISMLLVLHFHERVHHQGRGITLNELRSNGYWILRGSKLVQSILFRCVTCRKQRRPVEEQMMANLPDDRLDPSPPFTYSAMDCFGPFIVKKARKEFKRYGLLFTCLCCRGVHIEMLEDLSTDCFINSLRCFIALRGAVKQLRCDQGTNFIGAKNELREALKELDLERVQVYLAERQCEFLFNAPGASHAGGVWERQIRSIRNILNVTVSNCAGRLDDGTLRTFLYEAMAIVNSRPLSVTNLNDPLALEPLTPNHILQMKSKQALPPPGEFVKEDLYLAKRWRRVQYLSKVFWERWRKEYILNLTERQKWSTPRRNLMVGDLVLVKDDLVARMDWSLARVSETIQDDDGLVRRVKIIVGSKKLDKHGRRIGDLTTLERPIQKLVVLVEAE